MKALKKISNLTPKKDEIYLLDTCFLLYNFFTVGSYNRSKVTMCNRLLTLIIKSNSKILIFPELIEEFFNRFIKLEYELYNDKHKEDRKTYKEFRKTEDFTSAIKELKEIYNSQIKPYSITVKSEVTVSDFDCFLENLSDMDINDMIICKVAQKNNAILITDDNDYFLNTLTDNVSIYHIS